MPTSGWRVSEFIVQASQPQRTVERFGRQLRPDLHLHAALRLDIKIIVAIHTFIVGNGQIFEEFENGVLDMKKGETKEITIDFASDYGDDTVAGKEVVYKVTVQNVRRAPELTDEWVTKNTDYTTVDEYKDSVYNKLEEDAKASAQEVLKNTAWTTLLENSEVKEYPQDDIDKAVDEFKKNMELYAKQADMTLDEFVESQGISQDDFDEQCQQYAQGKVKQNLIVQGIMDTE